MPTVRTDDLVSAKVITVRLGLSRTQRVHELVRRLSDPMPSHVVAQPRIHLWLWSEIAPWARRQGYVVVEPGMWVEAETIRDRLDLDPVGKPQADGDGELWSWSDAEAEWVDRQMNVHDRGAG